MPFAFEAGISQDETLQLPPVHSRREGTSMYKFLFFLLIFGLLAGCGGSSDPSGATQFKTLPNNLVVGGA